MRNFQVTQGKCYEMRYQQRLEDGAIPGEVHQQLKSLDVLQDDLLWRFEHIN